MQNLLNINFISRQLLNPCENPLHPCAKPLKINFSQAKTEQCPSKLMPNTQAPFLAHINYRYTLSKFS